MDQYYIHTKRVSSAFHINLLFTILLWKNKFELSSVVQVINRYRLICLEVRRYLVTFRINYKLFNFLAIFDLRL